MSLLFTILVVLGFALMLTSRIPNTRMPEWPAWLSWFIASLIWAVPLLSSAS